MISLDGSASTRKERRVSSRLESHSGSALVMLGLIHSAFTIFCSRLNTHPNLRNVITTGQMHLNYSTRNKIDFRAKVDHPSCRLHSLKIVFFRLYQDGSDHLLSTQCIHHRLTICLKLSSCELPVQSKLLLLLSVKLETVGLNSSNAHIRA